MVKMCTDPAIAMCDFLLIGEMLLRDRGDHAKYVREVLHFLTRIDLLVDSVAQAACHPKLDMSPVRLGHLFDSPNVLVLRWGRLPRGSLTYIRFSKLKTDDISIVNF